MERAENKYFWFWQGGEISMIWKDCILLEQVETGEDALGNPIYDTREVKSTKARFTPWTDEQISLEGREVTKNEQRYIIPIPFKDFPVCHFAEIECKSMEITQIIDLSPRHTSIQVKIYKE